MFVEFVVCGVCEFEKLLRAKIHNWNIWGLARSIGKWENGKMGYGVLKKLFVVLDVLDNCQAVGFGATLQPPV
jgi:hypothetical protein